VRIAIVTDTFTPQINGVTTVVRRIADAVREAGHTVALAAPRYPERHARGSTELRLPSLPFPPYPALRLTLPAYPRLARFLDRARPELVHVPVEGPLGLLGRRYALRRRLPLVTAYHTNFPQYMIDYGVPRLARTTWRWLLWFHRPSCLTYTPGTEALESLQSRGLAQARQWGCGVDTRVFHPRRRSVEWRRSLQVADDTAVVLHVGRLAPEKNLETLIEAWRALRDRLGPRIAFVIAGDGPQASRLSSELPWVHRMGFLDRDTLARVYASADICMLPSKTETCGLVALEAMASGLAVVAADAGGFRDSIRSQATGLLASPDDPRSYTEAVENLVEHPGRRSAMATAARQAAEARDVATENRALLEDLMNLAGDQRESTRAGACTAA
jgi:glycosyltransferase involved in cell wall biosynthesis